MSVQYDWDCLSRLISLLIACSCEQMHSQGSNPPSAMALWINLNLSVNTVLRPPSRRAGGREQGQGGRAGRGGPAARPRGSGRLTRQPAPRDPDLPAPGGGGAGAAPRGPAPHSQPSARHGSLSPAAGRGGRGPGRAVRQGPAWGPRQRGVPGGRSAQQRGGHKIKLVHNKEIMLF